MWIKFYHNAMTEIRQWFESLYFEPTPKLIKVRIKQSAALLQTRTRQRRMYHSSDRY